MRRLGLLLLLLVAVVVPAPAGAAEPVLDSGEASRHANAMRIRDMLGLRSDIDRIRAADEDRAAYPEEPLGIPMSRRRLLRSTNA